VSAQFSISSIAAVVAFSADPKKRLHRERLQDQDTGMSKRDPGDKDTYIIKTADAYVVVIEGQTGDTHIAKNNPHYAEVDYWVSQRQKAGLELSNLLKNLIGLTTMSNVHATHTTGAGDYEPAPTRKKKKH
jgi:hypothetical protein